MLSLVPTCLSHMLLSGCVMLAFHINYSFCCSDTNTSEITCNWMYPPGQQCTIITINLSDYFFVYSDVHYSKNMCFQLGFRLQCRAAPTLLMTPVPCNFFSVANSDYRVGVKLQAKHHLFQLLFSVCSVFNMGPAAVRLNSRFDEAVFNTEMIKYNSWLHYSPWLLIFNALFVPTRLKIEQGKCRKHIDISGADWSSLIVDRPAAKPSFPRRAINALHSCQISVR